MARLHPGSLGTPIGKQGKTVFRRNKKKIFTYETSGEPIKIKSEKAQKNRFDFGKLSKFCNFVNRSVLIKKAWKLSKLPGTATNRQILKYNHLTHKLFGINSNCHILPRSIFMNNPSVTMDENSLSFRFTTVDDQIGYNEKFSHFNPPYVFMAAIHAKDTVNPENERQVVNIMIEETLEKGPLSREDYTSYTFDVPEKAFSFIDDYNTVLVFPAVVTIDEYNTPINWTETGGIYVRGEHPEIIKPPLPKPIEKPGKSFRVEFN
jgi:hypothetical protein